MMRSILKLAVRRTALTAFMAATILMPQISCGEIITTTVGVGLSPVAVAVNQVTNKAYVVNFRDDTVSVIDGTTGAVIGLPVHVGKYPVALAVNPTTNKVYVVSQQRSGNGEVNVIDGANDVVSATVTVQSLPSAIAVNPLTNKIYVANSFGNSVTVIDGASDTSSSTVMVEYFPSALAVNTLTNRVYVANSYSSSVTVIDGATDTVSALHVPVGKDPLAVPFALAVNPTTNKVYVMNKEYTGSNGIVTVINGATDTVSGSPLSVGSVNELLLPPPFPNVISVNPVTNMVYVANRSSADITVINGATDTVSGLPIPVGTTPYAVAVNTGTNKVFVANHDSHDVTLIDGATNTFITTLTASSTDPPAAWDGPRSIAVNTDTNKVYMANDISNNVTIIPNFYSVSITKFGAGNVNSLPVGINCGATCSASFPEGPAVLLFQTPDTNSGFSGWGGACSGTGDCAFSMLSDKVVTADFTLSPQVKNKNTGVAYDSLQSAYAKASNSDTIMARSTLTPAALSLNSNISLTIEGGYDADYSSVIGLTKVLGRVNVSTAPLKVHGVAIRTP